MAKEKKNQSEENKEKNTVVSLDNIDQVVDKGNLADELMSKAVLEDFQKEKDEKIKNEMKARYGRAKYDQLLSLFKLKKSRAEEAVAKKRLALSNGLILQMMGGTVEEKNTIIDGKYVEPGTKVEISINYLQYDELKRKADNDIAKELSEIQDNYYKDRNKLRSGYEGLYRSWWDD